MGFFDFFKQTPKLKGFLKRETIQNIKKGDKKDKGEPEKLVINKEPSSINKKDEPKE